MLTAFFTNTISFIKKPTINGYGKKEFEVIYENVPCRFREGNIILYSVLEGGKVVDLKIVAEAIISPLYANILSDYLVVYNDKEYLIGSVSLLQAPIGPIQGYKLTLKNNG